MRRAGADSEDGRLYMRDIGGGRNRESASLARRRKGVGMDGYLEGVRKERRWGMGMGGSGGGGVKVGLRGADEDGSCEDFGFLMLREGGKRDEVWGKGLGV